MHQLPRDASTLIFKIRSCTVRSDPKKKAFSAAFVLIFKIRSHNARSDLKNKSARFSGLLAMQLQTASRVRKVIRSLDPGEMKAFVAQFEMPHYCARGLLGWSCNGAQGGVVVPHYGARGLLGWSCGGARGSSRSP